MPYLIGVSMSGPGLGRTESFRIWVFGSDTIAVVKGMLWATRHIAAHKQEFRLQGQVLTDELTLIACGLVEHVVVEVIVAS
jgi:hypothetical protein